ncbi:MAG: dnaB [Gammaproteobacteria bacterium]|jgi:replicative DNA helicase|nr:dnaB [Gammaproteobacteria bacterium]
MFTEPEYFDSPSEPNQDSQTLKVPPHSVSAEQSVLGALLLDNNAWDVIADRISELDFYRREHKIIFGAICELIACQKPIDVITISETLKARDLLQEIGGDVFLYQLAASTHSTSNVAAYADIVRERSIMRQLITATGEISRSAFNPEGRSSSELLDEAEQKVFAIAEQGTHRFAAVKMSQLLTQAVTRMDELQQSKEPLTGLTTGFADLDEMTSGLQRGDLVIVAARPSMGKTVLMMNMVENIIMRSDNTKPALVFSMEMSGEQLALRLISSQARVEQNKVRTGQLTNEDWFRVTDVVGKLSSKLLFVDDTPALSPGELRARARRLAREHGGISVIAVDYLQLMQVPGAKENRTTEVSEISRNLKAVARELNVPLIAVSQLNRGLEQRQDKRPVMSDLRESGAIEQDADLIMFIYRDQVYNEATPDKGIAEVIIGKQRNGPIGKVRLAFLGEFTRFDNLAASSYHRDVPSITTESSIAKPVMQGSTDNDNPHGFGGSHSWPTEQNEEEI